MLEVENLHAGYNRGDVLRGINLRVGRGDIVGLLGANGVGKSTLALSISGMTRISSGDIRLNGQSIVGMRPEKIVEMGLVQVASGRPNLPDLKVEGDLRRGANSRPLCAH